MLNNVMNEIIFRGLDADSKAAILAAALNTKGEVDFNILVPAPINIWWGSTGSKHEKAFRVSHLDWAVQNWGTKWSAYSQQPIEQTVDTLTLRFQTAWRPPYGWLVAIFNKFRVSFDHNWLDEGAERGVCGKFKGAFIDDDLRGDPWTEVPADDAMHRHLHKLKWGVEEFTDDDAA